MPENNQLVYFWSGIALILGLLLQIVPLSATSAHWRPQFLLLVVVYWLFRNPFQHGIIFAWLAGLLLDGFIGELLGRYALVFALCAYLLHLLQQRFHLFGVLHQTVVVFVIVLLSQLLLHSITLIFRAGWNGDLLLAPAISSAVIWPLLTWLFDRVLRMKQLGQEITSESD
jgi:rod shape-determining protein MreD